MEKTLVVSRMHLGNEFSKYQAQSEYIEVGSSFIEDGYKFTKVANDSVYVVEVNEIVISRITDEATRNEVESLFIGESKFINGKLHNGRFSDLVIVTK